MLSFDFLLLPLFLPYIFASRSLATSVDSEEYDYIVVGSGPGGAPVAAQLAQHGYSVLLMDAGDDQRSNTNTSIAVALADVAAEDEAIRWDFFVKYHRDDEIANSNRYFTWRTPDGEYSVGATPPNGSERLGIYYPRSGTLGGCSAHNAGAAMLPQDSFWDHIANITEDDSWRYGLTLKSLTTLFKMLVSNRRFVAMKTCASISHSSNGICTCRKQHQATALMDGLLHRQCLRKLLLPTKQSA